MAVLDALCHYSIPSDRIKVRSDKVFCQGFLRRAQRRRVAQETTHFAQKRTHKNKFENAGPNDAGPAKGFTT
jgi:hypothetical protein